MAAKKEQSCCELCDSEARIFCESDQARLCWDCDEKVHAANCVAAKHARVVLCKVCHCRTPWKASGPRLGRTVSVCCACVAGSNKGCGGFVEEEGTADHRIRAEEREDDGSYVDDCDTDDDDEVEEDYDSYSDDDDDDDDDDDENQVVPGTSMPPESGSSSSCSEGGDSSRG